MKNFINYKTVTIGSQVWMKENLNVSNFRNGDPIPEAKTSEEWETANDNKQPAWCYYDDDPTNGEKYGKLYNWYVVNDPRGLAPEGWHVPSDEEWTQLTDYLGGSEKAGAKMKSKNGWRYYSEARGYDIYREVELWSDDHIGTNSSGFSGLPGGYREGPGFFEKINYEGKWWCSTDRNIDISPQVTTAFSAWFRGLGYDCGVVYRFDYLKGSGFSVRCLMD